MRPSDVYLAFASGALTYTCQPCGRCCCGLGIADDVVRIGDSAASPLLPWLNADTSDAALASAFTFADGCRFLATDNLCDIHKQQGASAKPRICRLFPFSQLVIIDGLWTLLPHQSCPWQAREGSVDDGLSLHTNVLRELDNDTHDFLDGLRPMNLRAVTALPPQQRRAMEEHIRDALVGTLDKQDGTAASQLACVRSIQTRHLGAPIALPADGLLWCDMLRSAGQPPPLPPPTERLLAVALPTLRARLFCETALSLIPNTLTAFVLWLRCLAEVQTIALSGEDLLRLFDHALPLARLMAMADLELPQLPPQAPTPALQQIWPELCERAGSPIGEALLVATQPYERGTLPLLMALGVRVGPAQR